jgi:hypothetical protein
MQRRTIAILMTLEATSLVAMSAIHLARSEPNSGIPEAVICVVLALGATASSAPHRAGARSSWARSDSRLPDSCSA